MIGDGPSAADWSLSACLSLHQSSVLLSCILGIPKRLADMGVGADRIDEMTAMALEDPSAGGNPVTLTTENTRALFEAVI